MSMTAKQIESTIKTASKCIEKDAQLEKKLEMAEWDGKPTARIESSIKLNKTKMYIMIGELAREELRGTDIDYSFDTGVADFVGEEVQEIEGMEGDE